MKNNYIISLTNSLLFSFPPSQLTTSTCQPHEQTEGYVSSGHRPSTTDYLLRCRTHFDYRQLPIYDESYPTKLESSPRPFVCLDKFRGAVKCCENS